MLCTCRPHLRPAGSAAASKRACIVQVSASSSNGRTNTTIHRLIKEEGTITVPGCYDALSAIILQQAGHHAGFVSGAAVSASQLGEPDIGLLTPPEMARRTGQICGAAPNLPVITDADSGGGSVLNVQRTIRSLIAAGARGCVLEDQAWPKRMGYVRNKEVVAREEFVAKLLAAREVIGDADFFLVARTDARGTSAKHGLEDACTRANLYIDAGADAHLVGGLRSVDELRIVGEKTKGIKVANMVEGGVTPLCSTPQCEGMGFSLVVYPLSALYAAAHALQESYGTLARSGSSQERWESMVSWRAFNEIVGLEEKFAKEEHFTAVKGPASDISDRLRVKIKGLVKPVNVH